jgi:V/A-type H+/Na+-transporting ATPase subunit E
MSEELKSLLDRIQKDGVDRAEAEAQKILADARRKAAEIVGEAGRTAHAARDKAEQDAAAFMERARKSLEQAARDVILSVRDAVNDTFSAIAREKVQESMTPETVSRMILTVVETYAANLTGDARLDILLAPAQQKQVVDLLMAGFRERLGAGVDIKADAGVVSGFRVRLVNDQVEHDFTGPAIAAALCQLLRPHIGEIVKSAIQE